MRVRKTSAGLTVRAIAGSHVVLLAMHLDASRCPGLLGFAIHRSDHDEDEAYWLEGMKTFAATDPGFGPEARYSTRQHPIQGFTWSDFSAKPGHRYSYRVVALRGSPENLLASEAVTLTVATETEAGGDHDVFFNRGAAASQEYARRFADTPSLAQAPDTDPRWAWLSRGAFEAIEQFIAAASGPGFGLRVAAYEFRLPAVAEALRAARARGVDVQIVYDGCPNPPDAKTGAVFPRDDNRATAAAAQLQAICTERVTQVGVKNPPISHHKFIVRLQGGAAEAVLTGSTNFSRGGVFGQSNVVHVVQDPKVAAAYLQCWQLIAANPTPAQLKPALAALNVRPAGKPLKGGNWLFSPQPGLEALNWYAEIAARSPGALFMTFAFGMNDLFKAAYRQGQAPLRYALLDKLLGPGISKARQAAEEAEMLALRKMPQNRFAVGNRIAANSFDRWAKETLTGLNSHVQYIHTKFLLADPLGPDPIVITGSANFSAASTNANDENMLVIRGNKRVADIYLGEYMRLWNHYAFREWLAAGAPGATPEFKHLDVKDRWWRGYFGNSDRSRQRAYFAGVAG